MPSSTAKMVQTNYDLSILASDAERECCYCLTRGEVRAILGYVEQWGWETRWYSDAGEPIDPVALLEFAADLSRRLSVTCGETALILRRINPETGAMEISEDHGGTWQQDPQDPRIAGVAMPPPITSGVSEDICAASGSGLTALQAFVTEILAQKTLEATLVEFLLAIATLILGLLVAPFYALFTAVLAPLMAVIFSADASAITDAMDTDTYQTFICILADHMDEDGSFDQEGFDACLADIATKIDTGIAQDICSAFLKSLGLLGLNNVCASGVGSAYTCDGCNPLCGDDFAIGNVDGFTSYGTALGVFDGKHRFQSEAVGGENILTIRTPDANTCCYVSSVDVVSGSKDGASQNFIPCGTSQIITNLSPGDFLDDCVNLIGIDSPTAFVIDILFIPCA